MLCFYTDFSIIFAGGWCLWLTNQFSCFVHNLFCLRITIYITFISPYILLPAKQTWLFAFICNIQYLTFFYCDGIVNSDFLLCKTKLHMYNKLCIIITGTIIHRYEVVNSCIAFPQILWYLFYLILSPFVVLIFCVLHFLRKKLIYTNFWYYVFLP